MSNLDNFEPKIRDLRMISRAVANGWNIPDKVMKEMGTWLMKIASDEGVRSDHRVKASDVLIKMFKCELDRVRLMLGDEETHTDTVIELQLSTKGEKHEEDED